MNRRYSNAEQKERIRQRVRVQIDEENYQFFPERKDPDYYDNDVNQRVGVYVRVSTDDPRQTTSYELQKKYYEDFVVRHPKWTLVDIYADEGMMSSLRLFITACRILMFRINHLAFHWIDRPPVYLGRDCVSTVSQAYSKVTVIPKS